MQNRDKLNKRIAQCRDGLGAGFVDVNFKQHIEKKILGYQTLHILTLLSIFKKSNTVCAVDCSETGTGKTYTSLALCGQLDLEPIIICPKSVICYWKDICDEFGVKPKSIINYEAIKKGKELDDDMEKIKSDMVCIENGIFVWKGVDKNKNIIIFDEAHRCKNQATLNGKLLISAKGVCRILLLSATIAQKYDDFLIFGYMLDIYRRIKSGRQWIESVMREDLFKFSSKEPALASHLYPKYGSRMSHSDMSQNLKKNNVTAQCYSLDDKSMKQVEKLYGEVRYGKAIALVTQMEVRKKVELLKLPIFIDLIEKYLDVGKSIVVFVNFLDSMNGLLKYFNKKSIDCSYVRGDQTIEERTNNIANFQNNEVRLIICTITAGAESISLHDTAGDHPRVSLISPSFSGKDLCQALGRIYRTGTKSVVEQKIIFCDEATERSICSILKDKIKFMDSFADYDKMDHTMLDCVAMT